MEEIEIGFRSRSKYADVPVTWCEDIRFVPNGKPNLLAFSSETLLIDIDPSKTPFIFAHEFFDALPIHAFQSVAPSPADSTQTTIPGLSDPIPLLTRATAASQTPQWRELVVSPTPPPTESPSSSTPLSPSNPDFQLSLSSASTPSSLVLPETSHRYRALKPHPSTVIEISPESHSYAAEFARRIGGTPLPTNADTTTKAHPSGAALILDYGTKSTVPSSTLRGIRSHKLVSPFETPGLVDISADVDFTALAEAAVRASPGVEVHGPVEQGNWLEAMGIWERAEALMKKGNADGVRKAEERLVDRAEGGMGW